MNATERDQLQQFLGALRQTRADPKDPTADGLIREAIAAQADAPYLLVQRAMGLGMALDAAQTRMAQLEAQCAQQLNELTQLQKKPGNSRYCQLEWVVDVERPSLGAWTRNTGAALPSQRRHVPFCHPRPHGGTPSGHARSGLHQRLGRRHDGPSGHHRSGRGGGWLVVSRGAKPHGAPQAIDRIQHRITTQQRPRGIFAGLGVATGFGRRCIGCR